MWRRRVLLMTVVAVAALVALWRYVSARDAVTPANAARIEVGMSEAEVERLLGGPAGDYSRPAPRYGLFGPECLRLPASHGTCTATSESVVKTWRGDEVEVEVYFDRRGQVEGFDCGPTTDVRPTAAAAAGNLLSDIRSWFGL